MAARSETPIIRLQSGDKEMFETTMDVAVRSGTIKQLIHDLSIGAGDGKQVEGSDEFISLLEVKSSILKKVLEYAEYHKNDPPPLQEDEEYSSYRTDDIIPWDQEFLRLEQSVLLELTTAANYLDMRPLLDICCKVIANMIKGKTVEEVRATFNIDNDFSASEEEAIRKENEWCEDRDTRE